MKTKEQKQAEYKERQRKQSQQVFEREQKRKARAERNLMHKAVAMVGDDLEQKLRERDFEAAIDRSPGIIRGEATRVFADAKPEEKPEEHDGPDYGLEASFIPRPESKQI